MAIKSSVKYESNKVWNLIHRMWKESFITEITQWQIQIYF